VIVRFVDIGGIDDYHCSLFKLSFHNVHERCWVAVSRHIKLEAQSAEPVSLTFHSA
jgi:hypothetical protein